MAQSLPPSPSPLALPPAILNTRDSEPHPDSEEFINNERHRVARELQPIEEATSSELHSSSPVLRSRRTNSSSSSSQSTTYRASAATTVTDLEGPDAYNTRSTRLHRQVPHWYDPVVKFWTSQISLTIDEGSHRDHLALERTFLGYLRTSLAFSMTGVLIAQLFRLQHALSPHRTFGFFVLGIPLATVFIAFAMIVLIIGAFRFWRQQNAMVRGKIYGGGWELTGIMVFTALLFLAVFALVVAVDIHKEL